MSRHYLNLFELNFHEKKTRLYENKLNLLDQEPKVCSNKAIRMHSTALLRSLIIKITISSIVIGFKNSYFPLIHTPSCYRTACYRTVQQTNHIQSCSSNQPITTLVSITIETVYKLLNLCILYQFFNVNFPLSHNLAIFLFSEIVICMINWQ